MRVQLTWGVKLLFFLADYLSKLTFIKSLKENHRQINSENMN